MNIAKNGNIIIPLLFNIESITDFFKEVKKMSNFNKGKMNKERRKKQFYAIIGLVLVAAMLITTFVSALFVY